MLESLALVIAIAHITAAVALFNGVLTCLAQAKVAAQAIESIGRQPEARGPITSAMFVGLAMCETGGIYGLLISIIMLFANPLVSIFLENAAKFAG